MKVKESYMFIELKSMSLYGITTSQVSIEISVANRGFPSFDIVGLPGKEISESKHRIITALKSSNISIAQKKIVINLAPADIKKEGSYYDLPIAAGLIALISNYSLPKNAMFFGELSLNGEIRYTNGSFLAALFAKEYQIKSLFVPIDCQKEAAFAQDLKIFGVKSLQDLILHLSHRHQIKEYLSTKKSLLVSNHYKTGKNKTSQNIDFSQIIGQEKAKRALTISAAGGHNTLLEGVPGAGKTMLARAYRTLLPSMTYEESVEVIKIYSAKGILDKDNLLSKIPPFRLPHHTISYSGMIGGGANPKPGEISLAHRGVLFMDEFLEFPKDVLEALRQPLENHNITLTRSRGSVTFPAKFILLAACNPCPCGFKNHPRKKCLCTPRQIHNYRKKLSGPLIDRMDIFVSINPVEIDKITKKDRKKNPTDKANTVKLCQNIKEARKLQHMRFKNESIVTNSEMQNFHIKKYCCLTKNAKNLLKHASIKLDYSARAYFKTIKVSQTIADLEMSPKIKENHVAEAVSYRKI